MRNFRWSLVSWVVDGAAVEGYSCLGEDFGLGGEGVWRSLLVDRGRIVLVASWDLILSRMFLFVGQMLVRL